MKKKGTQFDTIFHPARPQEMSGAPASLRTSHTVEAWAPEHVDEPWAKAHPSERYGYEGSSSDPGIRPMASMSWHHQTGEIKGVYTHTPFQRQGIASSLWHEGHRISGETRGVPKPKHSADRTRSGEAWSKAVGGHRPPLAPYNRGA